MTTSARTATPRRPRRTMTIAAVALAAAMVAANAVALWAVLDDRPARPVAADGNGREVDDDRGDEPHDGEIVTLPAMTTTVGESATSFARISMAVVLEDGADVDAIPERTPLLQDALLLEMASTSTAELRSPAGSLALRETMTTHARRIWGADTVDRVLFTELLVD